MEHMPAQKTEHQLLQEYFDEQLALIKKQYKEELDQSFLEGYAELSRNCKEKIEEITKQTKEGLEKARELSSPNLQKRMRSMTLDSHNMVIRSYERILNNYIRDYKPESVTLDLVDFSQFKIEE